MKSLFFFLGILFVQSFIYAQTSSKKWWQVDEKDSLVIEALSVNSIKNDYSSIYLEGILYFTSDRTNINTDEQDLQNNEDIYSSMYQDSVWMQPEKQYFFNTDDHTALAGFSYDGPKLFTYKTFGNGDLYVSDKVDGKWSIPLRMKYPINTTDHEQSIAEFNGIMIVSSGEPENHDLYWSKKDIKSGKYKEFVFMEGVNTSGDDVDVSLSPDGKTLYFSSNGLSGGGYDIFYTQLDTTMYTWSRPEKLRLVNSTYDERSFRSYDSLFFFDSNKPGGPGAYDLYWGHIVPKEIPKKEDSIPKVDTVPSITKDTVPVFTQVDTVPSVSRLDTVPIVIKVDTIPLITKMDTMPEYYARIQVGAYRTCKDLNMFRYYYPAFDSTSLYIEEMWDPKGTIYKYLINQSFIDLNAAEQRRKSAAWQQGHEINNYNYTRNDAFIVVFTKEGKRVIIYFNYPDNYLILDHQEYEKIKKYIIKIS